MNNLGEDAWLVCSRELIGEYPHNSTLSSGALRAHRGVDQGTEQPCSRRGENLDRPTRRGLKPVTSTLSQNCSFQIHELIKENYTSNTGELRSLRKSKCL